MLDHVIGVNRRGNIQGDVCLLDVHEYIDTDQRGKGIG